MYLRRRQRWQSCGVETASRGSSSSSSSSRQTQSYCGCWRYSLCLCRGWRGARTGGSSGVCRRAPLLQPPPAAPPAPPPLMLLLRHHWQTCTVSSAGARVTWTGVWAAAGGKGKHMGFVLEGVFPEGPRQGCGRQRIDLCWAQVVLHACVKSRLDGRDDVYGSEKLHILAVHPRSTRSKLWGFTGAAVPLAAALAAPDSGLAALASLGYRYRWVCGGWRWIGRLLRLERSCFVMAGPAHMVAAAQLAFPS